MPEQKTPPWFESFVTPPIFPADMFADDWLQHFVDKAKRKREVNAPRRVWSSPMPAVQAQPVPAEASSPQSFMDTVQSWLPAADANPLAAVKVWHDFRKRLSEANERALAQTERDRAVQESEIVGPSDAWKGGTQDALAWRQHLRGLSDAAQRARVARNQFAMTPGGQGMLDRMQGWSRLAASRASQVPDEAEAAARAKNWMQQLAQNAVGEVRDVNGNTVRVAIDPATGNQVGIRVDADGQPIGFGSPRSADELAGIASRNYNRNVARRNLVKDQGVTARLPHLRRLRQLAARGDASGMREYAGNAGIMEDEAVRRIMEDAGAVPKPQAAVQEQASAQNQMRAPDSPKYGLFPPVDRISVADSLVARNALPGMMNYARFAPTIGVTPGTPLADDVRAVVKSLDTAGAGDLSEMALLLDAKRKAEAKSPESRKSITAADVRPYYDVITRYGRKMSGKSRDERHSLAEQMLKELRELRERAEKQQLRVDVEADRQNAARRKEVDERNKYNRQYQYHKVNPYGPM